MLQNEFFTSAILTKILIKDRASYNKDDVLKDISLTIDLSLFNIEDTGDSYILTINQELFCANIAYFLAEQYKFMNITEVKYRKELINLVSILKVNDFENYITYSKSDDNPLFMFISQSRGFAIVKNPNMSDSVSLEGIMYAPSPEIDFIECYESFVDAMTTLIHYSTSNPLARGVIFCNFYSCYMN